MSRIIFLSDVFDVKNEHTVPRSHFLDDEHRRRLYESNLKENYEFLANNSPVGNIKMPMYTFWGRYAGPYAVASNIKRKLPEWDVVVIDWFTKIPEESFADYLNNFITDDTEYIALSLTFLHNPFNPRQNAFNLWKFSHEELYDWFFEIKCLKPNIKFIVGGAIVDTLFKKHIIGKSKKPLPEVMSTFIDYAFQGYSEDSIIDLLTDKLTPMNVFEKDGVKFVNEPRTAGFGAPLYVNEWQKNWNIRHNEWLPLEVSKGCRFGCKFCFYDHSGTVIKQKEELRTELLRNYEMYGVKGYQLTDDTVNDSPAKIDMMYDVIKSLPFDVEWIAYTRPDMFNKYPEMYYKMLDMGCRGMFLGVETMTHKAGKIAGKGLHPDKMKEILSWLRQEGGDEVFILASFIVGLVGETEETLMETARWLREQNVLDKAQYEILFVTDIVSPNAKSDFSDKNEKFGIKEIRFEPEYYWKHDTLDLNDAKRIAQKWEEIMADHPKTRFERHANFNTSFWAYPRVRSLGYNHYEAVDVLTSKEIRPDIYVKNFEWINNYHQELLLMNK